MRNGGNSFISLHRGGPICAFAVDCIVRRFPSCQPMGTSREPILHAKSTQRAPFCSPNNLSLGSKLKLGSDRTVYQLADKDGTRLGAAFGGSFLLVFDFRAER